MSDRRLLLMQSMTPEGFEDATGTYSMYLAYQSRDTGID